MSADINETVTLSAIFSNTAEVPTDLDALATLTITLPDGTSPAPITTTHGTTGEYFTTYTPTQLGVHPWVIAGVMGGLPVRFADSFNVRSSWSPVALSEARTWFGLNDTDPSRDELIRDILDAASEDVEQITGRAVRRKTVTDTFNGGKSGVALRSVPVISVTSVTDSGGVISVGGYTVDSNSGILYRGSSLAPISFIAGHQNVVVVYVAGMAVVPARYRDAIREISRERYDLQRGGSGQPRQQTGGALSGRALAEKLLEHDKAPVF